MLLDLHIHTTRYSTACSLLEPRRLMAGMLELGLDGGAITEHDYPWSQAELDSLKRDCRAEHLFLVSGKEVESAAGHILVFGHAGSLPPLCPLPDLVGRVHEQGGVAVWAHPLRYGRLDRVPDRDIVATARLCDAIEALTPSHSPSENDRAARLSADFGLTAIGGSDAHSADSLGSCLTRFEFPLQSLSDLVNAIKSGRCRPQPVR
jgi:hypothetical protein